MTSLKKHNAKAIGSDQDDIYAIGQIYELI